MAVPCWTDRMCFVRPALQPHFRQIIVTLPTRMQQNKTNNYVYYFVYFLLYRLRSTLTASLRIISSKLSIRSNQSNIAAVACVASGADSCIQAVVSNRVQLRPAANFEVSAERRQGSSCRPNTSPHTKHALPKRAQPKKHGKAQTRLAPRLPLTQTLRRW